MSRPGDDRVLDLLAARATEGLDGTETGELRSLLSGDAEPVLHGFELAAAAADLAWMHENRAFETMPAEVRRRIAAQAEAVRSTMDSSATSFGTADLETPATADPLAFTPGRARPSGLPVWSGWLAAAAALVLLVISVLGGPERTAIAPDGTPDVDAAAARTDLLGQAGTLQLAWAPPEVEAYRDVRGDVVWNNATQSGYMRLAGLPTNRPDIEQYQLWIVDPARDEHPIDGGVFDIPAGADEVIIPIDAKLDVAEPKAFAITLEQPGGVVVSDGPLLVVAAVAS